jgi:hypothetical protein
MYPETFTEVIELFRYVKAVGTLLRILTPAQSPVTVLFVTVPSVTSVVWPDKIEVYIATLKNIAVFFTVYCFLINYHSF